MAPHRNSDERMTRILVIAAITLAIVVALSFAGRAHLL
jgi:hypothetical protein